MSLCRIFTLSVLIFIKSSFVFATSVAEYLPGQHNYNANLPTPESSLGFELGQRHPRHDQMLTYMRALEQSSDRIKITHMGKTSEFRDQILLTISSAQNLAKLDQLLANRKITSFDDKHALNEPLVIWLGYSVHGDEISGTNAAMAVAYHYAASLDKSIEAMLENTVIVMEPSINPDGMDKFVQWVNTHRGTTINSDANHIEHHQGWLTGRTNHFGFDLNRDWLLLSQQESQNRLHYFHQYQPNVLGDFHEMGANGTYFFQPGIPTRTHPLTPLENTEMTQLLAGYHAKALDKENRLYYSEESFDDFYYGKGSTYPDINASIGILFEQASSRGLQQESTNGVLTFEFGIKNHILTSLSTVEGTWNNKVKFLKYRKDFYQQAEKQAKKESFSGYLFTEDKDNYRLTAFLKKLKQHQINVYRLAEDFRHNSKLFNQEDSYYIPLVQPQYRVIQALFNQEIDFKDNTFYDVSGWTLPLAMNIEFHQVSRTWGLKLFTNPWQNESEPAVEFKENAYAYAFDWHHFLAPKLLNQLLTEDIKVKVATKAFSSMVNGQKRQFSAGTIVIPAGIQRRDNWQAVIKKLAQQSQIGMQAIDTGLTATGIDLGSSSLRLLSPIKVLLVGGKGVSQYEAGEIRFYLDKTLNIPLSVVEISRLNLVNLSAYTHIIMVDGNYNGINVAATNKIEDWLAHGGVIITQKRASKWLSEKNILKVGFVSESQIDDLFDTDNLTYKDKEMLAGRKRISGAIFSTELDNDHPLAYGFTTSTLPVFRNSTFIMNKASQPFMAVATYLGEPLMSGYADRNLVNRIANNPSMIAHNVKKGRVIATSDNLAFRGYWYGSVKLLSNSLFFAKAFSTRTKD